MGRPKGSKNKPKVITAAQIKALSPKRRGRPVGSKNKPKATIAEKTQSTTVTVDSMGIVFRNGIAIIPPPKPTYEMKPIETATVDFCPISPIGTHNGIHQSKQSAQWCTYCGTQNVKFPEREKVTLTWPILLKRKEVA